MDRRTFVKTALVGSVAASWPRLAAAEAPAPLRIHSRVLDVNGRAATVFGLTGPRGIPGLALVEGQPFNVALQNELREATLIHWHGLTPPWQADGVPGRPSDSIRGGEIRAYDFPVGSAGTHWMHAHSLQEQNLLAAPLIVRERDASSEQEVVMLLHDFSFQPATELLARLTGSANSARRGPVTHSADAAPHAIHGAATMDLNDIEYDAYLANDRTLADPEIFQVDKSSFVRLRIINGATATAFTIDLGRLQGELIAVDGQSIAPIRANRMPISMGQRVDIRVSIPSDGGSFPVLALREGARQRTGIVLATPGASIRRLQAEGEALGPVLTLDQESVLRARTPLSEKQVANRVEMQLTGDMATYRWGLTSDTPLRVRAGDRIEVTLSNTSQMSHPMHLHGHRFQVVAINRRAIAGAVRDTILVPPAQSVTIALDADNPGAWAFHCHHLYHMAAGMMAELVYDGFA